ncbi:hypothetical protein P7B02_03060 [Caulobacter segnis]|nr:hypothetical protein [Caulobacter segnis]MDG2520509.1 hypothetical protein [Caulobacter segnis]
MSAPDEPRPQESDAPLNRTLSPVAGNLGASRMGRAAAVTALAVVCG